MLYFVSTPIGNLKDVTLRALEVLQEVDYILCEDTRVSRKLLSHYSIEKPLKRADAHLEKKILPSIIEDLKAGKKIALISDAGTPLIQDPGMLVIQALIEEKIPYTIIPGPSSPISALILSGFPAIPFYCFGFISKGKKGEKEVETSLQFAGTLIFFETSLRIEKTLQLLYRLSPTRKMAIVREMTKIYEEVTRGYPEELLRKSYRGELLIVIGPKEPSSPSPTMEISEIQKAYDELILTGMHPKNAIQSLSEKSGRTKKELYTLLRATKKAP